MTYASRVKRPFKWSNTLFLIVAAIFTTTLYLILGGGLPSAAPQGPAVSFTNGVWPLMIVPNAGQSDPDVLFQAQMPGSNLSFTTRGLLFAPTGTDGRPAGFHFVGASTETVISAGQPQEGVVNYLLGSDPAGWQTNLPTYQQVSYKQLYPGISLVYKEQGNTLAAAFHLEPGANLSQIVWQIDGVPPALDEDGALQWAADGTGKAAMTLSPPQAWQTIEGQVSPISAAFSLNESGQVGLILGNYDMTRPLFIQTALLSGYGPAIWVRSHAAGPNGQAYLAGFTNAGVFPDPTNNNFIQGGTYDAFVAAYTLDSQSLLYVTLFGGNDAGDSANDIAVDNNGRAHVVGYTDSANFPLINPYQTSSQNYEAFLVILNPNDGSLEYSSYLGGNDHDYGQNIALGSNGEIYVSGETRSTNFPLVNPYQSNYGGGFLDAFLTVFAPDGQSLNYSTYFGGSRSDRSRGLALDGNGRTYLLRTAGIVSIIPDNPMDEADTFVTVFTPNGQAIVYDVGLIGSSYDIAEDIVVDSNGRAYLAGATTSTDFPTVNAYQPVLGGEVDAFVSALSADGQTILFSTYLGDALDDWAYGINLDNNGRILLAGKTMSPSFPLLNPFQSTHQGDFDGFVTILNSNGQSLAYSTFLGGSLSDSATAVSVDNSDHIITSGSTGSPDFPLMNPLQNFGGGLDGFITVFEPDGQSLNFSTYLTGEYPPPPTDVGLTGFGAIVENTAAWFWLLAGLIAVFGIGILAIRRRASR